MDSCLRRNDGEGAPVCRTRSFLHTRPFPHTRLLPSHPPLSVTSAPSVIPAEAGIHATAQPCDEPQSARRPTTAPSAPRVIGRRRTLGVPLTPTDRMDSCLRRNDGGGAGMTARIGLPHPGSTQPPTAPEPARTYKPPRSATGRPPSAFGISPRSAGGEGIRLVQSLPGRVLNSPAETQREPRPGSTVPPRPSQTTRREHRPRSPPSSRRPTRPA